MAACRVCCRGVRSGPSVTPHACIITKSLELHLASCHIDRSVPRSTASTSTSTTATASMFSRLGLPISPRYICSFRLILRRSQLTCRTTGHIVVGVCVIVIIFNLLEAIQLAYLWTALKWEPETEWDEWRMNGVRVVVALVCAYLFWTCCAAFIGLLGALKASLIFILLF